MGDEKLSEGSATIGEPYYPPAPVAAMRRYAPRLPERMPNRRLVRIGALLLVTVLLAVGMRACWRENMMAKPEAKDSHRFYPNLRHKGYGRFNPFTDRYKGICSWFVWGRAYEKCGVMLPAPEEGDWLSTASEQGLATGMEPRGNSVGVYGGFWGHVIFIEAIEGENAFVNEANGDTSRFTFAPPGLVFGGGGYDGGGLHGDGGGADMEPVSSLADRNGPGNLRGYIYLDDQRMSTR